MSNFDINLIKNIIKNILDVIIIVELDGTVTYVNSQVQDLLGYKPEEFVGIKIFHLIEPQDYPNFSKAIKRAKRLNVPITFECRIQHKQGHYIWVYGIGVFFQIKETTKNISIIYDITERKKYEKELEKFKLIVESAQDAIFYKDLESRYIIVNNKTIEAFGLFRKEVIGKNDLELMSDEKEAKKNIEHDQTVFKIGKPLEITKQMTKKDGKKIWFHAIKVPHFDKDGNLIGLIGIARDISEQKIAELKLNESKNKYRQAFNRAELYKDIFAHDINNILQNILSGIQLSRGYLDNKDELEEFTNFLNIIQKEVIRGASLVSNIRKLSQFEGIDSSLEPTEVNAILNMSIKNIKNTPLERKIEITVDNPYDKIFIKGNEFLKDIFENILNNAVRHNKKPMVKIHIKISKEQKKDKGYIKMDFLDNGMGIEDSRKPLIFLRAERESKSVRGGGLGLSLVKKIVELYNGQIIVKDRVKGDHTKGSNFILFLPEVIN